MKSLKRFIDLGLLLLVFTITGTVMNAQEPTPAPSAPLAKTFVSDEGNITFQYPVLMTAEQDSVATFFISEEDAFIFIELLTREDIESTDIPEENTSAGLLTRFFGDVGYSEPETVEIDEARTGARIDKEDESIFAFPVNEQVYGLIFVTFYTTDDDVRADYLEAALMIAESIRLTEGDEPLEGTAELISGLPEGFTADAFSFVKGILLFGYPAEWMAVNVPDLGILLTDEEGLFSIVVVGDLNLLLDMVGGEGNVNQIDSIYEVFSTILGSLPDETMGALVKFDDDGKYPVGTMDVSDEFGDSAIIAVELPNQQLIILIVSAEQGLLEKLRPILDTIIDTLVYEMPE